MKKEQLTWTTIKDIEVYDRFYLTKLELPFSTINFIDNPNLRKQYEGLIERELEFITTYSNVLFNTIGTTTHIPNYFAHSQIAQTREATQEEKGRFKKDEIIIPANIIFAIGLMEGEAGPNGRLEKALKELDDKLLHDKLIESRFSNYSKALFESHLKFARTNLKKNNAQNLLRFKGFYDVPKGNLYSKLMDIELGPGKLRTITNQIKRIQA